MDPESFRRSTAAYAPPEGLTRALQALWWDARGDWEKAHACAQERDDAAGMRVHAYLHRKEGDLPNAGYWYRRAGAAAFAGTLDEEWEDLTATLLAKG